MLKLSFNKHSTLQSNLMKMENSSSTFNNNLSIINSKTFFNDHWLDIMSKDLSMR
jgi:hypothetical protein